MREPSRFTVDGETWEVRCLQALDSDPLFEGARYRFSVESGSGTFEVVVRTSAIFVSLLGLEQRRHLQDAAERLVERLLQEGHREDATVRISGDGIALLGERRIAELLPLTKPKPEPAKTAAGH